MVVVGENRGLVNVGQRPRPLFVGLPAPLARPVVGREVELDLLRTRLCAKSSRRSALAGLPGAGKTALATALVYSGAAREHFHGGILWVGLGPKPDLDSVFGRLASILDLDISEEASPSTKAQSVATALQLRVDGEPVLLVVDDVWAWDHARPFLDITFPGCSHLVTTRDAAIARMFADEVTALGELSLERSTMFLAERCPKAYESDPGALRDLVTAVGGLPLALTLIATTLNDHSGQEKWVRDEIRRLKAAEARLALTLPEDRQGLEGVTPTLRAIVEMSVQCLVEDLASAFDTLGAMAPKPANFSRDSALALWGVWSSVNNAVAYDPELEASADDLLRILVDRSLIETAGEGRFAIHQDGMAKD